MSALPNLEAALTGAVVLGEGVDPARGRRTPLSEAATLGVAAGLALSGRKVVVELVDPAGLTRAADVLADLAAVCATGGPAFTAPLLVRVPAGDAPLPTVPCRTVVAARPGVAEHEARAALASGVPTVMFEVDEPVELPAAPPHPRVVVIALGAGVRVAAEAAAALAAELAVVVVDAGGPVLDAGAAERVRRAGRAVVVSHGASGLVEAVTQAAFWSLEAPVAEVPARSGVDAAIAAIRATCEE